MNNNFFQDCGFLVDDKDLNRELNDIRENYFSFNNRNTEKLSEGCSYGKNGKPCSLSLGFKDILYHRMQCAELTSAELDLVILGTIQSQTKSTSGCKRPCTNYFF